MKYDEEHLYREHNYNYKCTCVDCEEYRDDLIR